MKYLTVLLYLFSQLAFADNCINSHGDPIECFGNGSATKPSVSVGNELTGIYSSGNGDLRFAILGVPVARFDEKGRWVVLGPSFAKWFEAGSVNDDVNAHTTGAGNRYGFKYSGNNTINSDDADTLNRFAFHATLPSGKARGTDNNYGLYITGDGGTGIKATNWAIDSVSAANSQITGGLNNTPIGQVTPAPGTFTTLNATALEVNSKLLVSPVDPTIVSGFGDSPSVNHSNGSASFTVLVSGTGGSSRGVIGMPKAKNGWACSAADVSAPDQSMTQQTGSSASSVTLTNYVRTTGIPGNWSQNDLIEVTCFPN